MCVCVSFPGVLVLVLLWVKLPVLEATMRFNTDVLSFQQLCGGCAWALSWYSLDNSAAPLPMLVPDMVVVVPFPKKQAEQAFWPPKRLAKAYRGWLQRGSQRDSLQNPPDSVQRQQHQGGPEQQQEEAWQHDLDVDQALLNQEEESDEEGTESAELFLRGVDLQGLDVMLEDLADGTEVVPVPSSGTLPAQSPPEPAVDAVVAPVAAGEVQPSGDAADTAPASRLAVRAHREPPDVPGDRPEWNPALAQVVVPNGRISYHESKQAFEAICWRHKGCSLSRTALAKRRRGAGPPTGGRPLGMMAMWLEEAALAESKHAHKEGAFLNTLHKPGRLAARRSLSQLVGGPELLRLERGKVDGEESEPETLTGY